MSEMRLEPPTSAPPPASPLGLPAEPPASGSLAAGIALAWATMILGELLVVMAINFARSGNLVGCLLLPPVAIIAWGLVLLNGHKPRTGKGLLLGMVSIVAVLLLLVAACFGLFVTNYH